MQNKIPFVCTQTNLTAFINGEQRNIPFTNRGQRDSYIKLFESYNQGLIKLEDVIDTITPIKRIALSKDSRLELVDGNELYLKGSDKLIPAFMANRLLDFIDSGLNIDSLINFWNSCLRNPYYEAIEELFEFCTANNMPIQEDGSIIGYKKLDFVNKVQVPAEFEEMFITGDIVTYVDGSKVDRELADKYLAFVKEANSPVMTNVYKGAETVDQKIGDTVIWKGSREHSVKYSRTTECCGQNGIHVGSQSYSFNGDIRVLVSFLPEQVVAANSGLKKLRVWEYKVEAFVDSQKEINQKLVGYRNTFSNDTFENYWIEYEEGDLVTYIGTEPLFYVGNTYEVIEYEEETGEVMLINSHGNEDWVSNIDIKEKL